MIDSIHPTARYRLKYCLKGPLNPKQPTNQSIYPSGDEISDRKNGPVRGYCITCDTLFIHVTIVLASFMQIYFFSQGLFMFYILF